MDRLKRRRLRNQRLLDHLILGSTYTRVCIARTPIYKKMSKSEQRDVCAQILEHYFNYLISQSYNRNKRANSEFTSFTIR